MLINVSIDTSTPQAPLSMTVTRQWLIGVVKKKHRLEMTGESQQIIKQ